MDTFFRRHFKRKDAPQQETPAGRQRRPSVAVPTSKARRRSSVGLPSSALTQRRRSGIQLQPGAPSAGGGRLAKVPHHGRTGCTRRRSSTTTPSLNPKFAVCRRKVGKLRTIDTHLLGPSMLLASLIQMSEEEEEGGVLGAGLSAGEQQVELRDGANNGRTFSRSSSLHSDRDDDSSEYSTSSQSEGSQLSEAEQLPEEEEEEVEASWPPAACPAPTPSSISSLQVLRKPPEVLPPSRPLIRAPRCLRRNSSQVFVGDFSPFSYQASSQRKRRRISTISKAGSPWPGRGHPLPSRKCSVYYLHHPAFYRGPGALSPLGSSCYDSRLESLSAFLLYVAMSGLSPDSDPVTHLFVSEGDMKQFCSESAGL